MQLNICKINLNGQLYFFLGQKVVVQNEKTNQSKRAKMVNCRSYKRKHEGM